MLYKGSLINTQESEAAQTSLLKEEIFGQRGSFLSFFKQETKAVTFNHPWNHQLFGVFLRLLRSHSAVAKDVALSSESTTRPQEQAIESDQDRGEQ